MSSVGTHNLLDGEGDPTGFADIIIFTEAVPALVKKALSKGWDIFVCEEQKDLVICVVKGAWEHFSEKYKQIVKGIKLVTPHRGTYCISGRLWGQKTKIFAEHRINAAFPPFKRGEKWFRKRVWNRHRNMTCRWIRRSMRRGWEIFAGGDLNTIRDILGYKGILSEQGTPLDRVASTHPLRGHHVGSDEGSDHHKVWAETVRNLKRAA